MNWKIENWKLQEKFKFEVEFKKARIMNRNILHEHWSGWKNKISYRKPTTGKNHTIWQVCCHFKAIDF